jgi:hypothetical protein
LTTNVKLPRTQIKQLTSSAFEGHVGKTPDISEASGEANTCQQELEPGAPDLAFVMMTGPTGSMLFLLLVLFVALRRRAV